MTVQHQELEEPPTSEVVRLAQQMYERDRAEKERQSSLAAAAEEMGIPSEYLDKAAAQLKTRRMAVTQQPLARRHPVAVLLLGAAAVMFGALMLFILTYVRAEAPLPPTPVPIQLTPPPMLPSPTPGTGTRITPEPYPVPGMAVPPPAPSSAPPSPSTGY